MTVTLGTSRAGGLDISFAGLTRQTFQDFEIVLIDGRYHQRHAAVLEAARRYGLKQPLFHVPNHRYQNNPWGTAGAGYNTGFALAAGEFTVMLLDYAYAPPGWLAAHVENQEKCPKIAMGGHEYRTLLPKDVVTKDGAALLDFTDRQNVIGVPTNVAMQSIVEQREKIPEISAFKEEFKPEHLERYPIEEGDSKCKMPTQPLSVDYFNTKNESFPTESILDINGIDEHYDLGRGPGDPDVALRLVRHAGLQCWNVQEAIVHTMNPRRIIPNMNILSLDDGERMPPPNHERFTLQEGYAYFRATKASGINKAKNPMDLRDLRRKIWHWRELSQESEPVIPKNINSNEEYWRGV